ncbi:hypothetical protein ACFH1V_12780 [Acinetobacter baumannii]
MIILIVIVVLCSSGYIVALLIYAVKYKEKRQYFIASAIAVILGAMGITTLLAEHQSSKKSTVKQVYIGKKGGI